MTAENVPSPVRLGFDNTYCQLPSIFFQQSKPDTVPAPELIRFNNELAKELDLDLQRMSEDDLAHYFSGNQIFEDANPIAMAYAGHQFGSFVKQLGDGRALLLGEVVNKQGQRYDIQLKGSGQTIFSRGGDGKSALGPVLREYIISEAMHHLGIPTTRALAMVTTGEQVWRQQGKLPAGILTRVARGFIRIGTFEYFSARKNLEAIQQLADYAISRHFPEAKEAENPYLKFFQLVCKKQTELVPSWMRVGFIHGVMNTDNTSICGETIDYGPCAFMDTYDPDTVFSSIDARGRYGFVNQASIIVWNLGSLGNCLLPLLGQDQKESEDIFQQCIGEVQRDVVKNWQQQMNLKLALTPSEKEDLELMKEFLGILFKQQADYTLAFRYLADTLVEEKTSSRFKALFSEPEELNSWLEKWQLRLKNLDKNPSETAEMMNRVNPAVIPRNHRVERVIQQAEDQGSFDELHRLIDGLRSPYSETEETAEYMIPPKPEERVTETFCGT